MIGCGVQEDSTLIPGAGLDADVLMDGAQVLQLPVADGDDVFAEESHGGHVS